MSFIDKIKSWFGGSSATQKEATPAKREEPVAPVADKKNADKSDTPIPPDSE